jgi:hypothetical protein
MDGMRPIIKKPNLLDKPIIPAPRSNETGI